VWRRKELADERMCLDCRHLFLVVRSEVGMPAESPHQACGTYWNVTWMVEYKLIKKGLLYPPSSHQQPCFSCKRCKEKVCSHNFEVIAFIGAVTILGGSPNYGIITPNIIQLTKLRFVFAYWCRVLRLVTGPFMLGMPQDAKVTTVPLTLALPRLVFS
jgi:hypothetical protein